MRRMAPACFVVALLTLSTAADAPQPPDQHARHLMNQLAAAACEPSSQQHFDALAALGPAALPALTEGLRHRDSHVRFQALLLIGRLEGINTQRAPALVFALHDTDEHVRATAALLLKENGVSSVPLLLPALQHCRLDVRQAALELVVELDPEAAVPLLVLAIQDDGSLAYPALAALEKLGPRARSAVPDLLRLAKRLPYQRLSIVQVLAATKDDRARQVVPLLVKALADCPIGRGRALNEPFAAHDFFHGTDLEWTGRLSDAEESLQALAALGPLAAEALPEVRCLLGKANAWKIHEQAVDTLAALGEDPTPFLPQLLDVRAKQSRKPASEEGKRSFRSRYSFREEGTALQRLMLHDSAIVAQLTRQVCDVRLDESAAPAAVQNLFALRPEHHALVPHLKKALDQTGDRAARIAFLHALAKLGPVAIPVLREELSRVDQEPRDRALEELLRFMPRDPELIRLFLMRMGESFPAWNRGESIGSLFFFVDVHRRLLGQAEVARIECCLSDRNARVRAGALVWLQAPGLDPATRLCAYQKGLHDQDPRVRAAGIWGINRLGVRGAPAIPGLIENLSYPDENVVEAAIRALGTIGHTPAHAAPPLLEASIHFPADVSALLKSMGPAATPALLAALKHPKAEVRLFSLDFLGSPGGKTSAALIRPLLKDPDLEVSHAAALTLANLDPPDASGFHLLVDILDHDESGLPAALALTRLGPTGCAAVVNKIRQRLADEDWIRDWATLNEALPDLGPEALPILRAALHHEFPVVRGNAIRHLAAVKAPGRVQDLLAVLQGGNVEERTLAAELLGKLGSKALAAVPALRRAAREDKPTMRLQAAIALAQIKGRDTATAILLTSMLERCGFDHPTTLSRNQIIWVGKRAADKTPCFDALLLAADPATLQPLFVRLAVAAPDTRQGQKALQALVRLGPGGAPQLRWLLRHRYQVVREHTVQALGEWPASRAELESLLLPVARHDPAAHVRDLALRSLAQKQAAPEIVLPWLRDELFRASKHVSYVDYMNDANAYEQYRQARSKDLGIGHHSISFFRYFDDDQCGLLSGYGPVALPILVANLEHADPVCRIMSIKGLGNLGPVAKAALPGMYRLLQRETDLDVRAELWTAIDRIVPPVWRAGSVSDRRGY